MRKGSVLCPGLGAGAGLGKMCGSEGQSVGLGMAGCGGSGDEGNEAERRVPWGLAQERKGGRGVGGEPLPCPMPTGTCCPPYGRVGQEGVGVEDGVVGDIVSAEVEEPCQERDLPACDCHCPPSPRVRAHGTCHGTPTAPGYLQAVSSSPDSSTAVGRRTCCSIRCRIPATFSCQLLPGNRASGQLSAGTSTAPGLGRCG